MSDIIRVLTTEQTATGTKGILDQVPAVVEKAIDIEVLKKSLREFGANLAAIFAEIDAGPGYALDQITVGIEISASGGVALVGTATAGAKAAITLNFRPRKPAA